MQQLEGPRNSSGVPSKALEISENTYAAQCGSNEEYEDDDSKEQPASVWLVEHEHSIQVTKYSSTMQQGNHNTLPFMTMSAFAHFSHYWSQETQVFVDLQSSPAVVNGSVHRYLFDTMNYGTW
ncbi:kinase-like protein [Moniliophthora roreri]|nr:kinase-like protein [Moniliophthora roreri]KAI3618337.1 kinase-like protein [Moniliophthora roreri]